MTGTLAPLAYIIATVLFIFALHWMNTPTTARKGVYAGVAGMTIASHVTWAQPTVVHHLWIVVALINDANARAGKPALDALIDGISSR